MYKNYKCDNNLINKRNLNSIGKRHKSKLCGYFTVIGINSRYRNNSVNTESKYICQFDDGFQTISTISNITKGKVYNPYHPTHSGVGCLGEEYKKSKESRFYNRWKRMLERCTLNHINYENVEISKEWLNFSNYVKDIKYLKGFKEYEQYKDIISFEIDKDIIGNSKLYSKETCCIVPKKINSFFTKIPSNNTSGIKGVIFDKDRGKWKAQYVHNSKSILNKRFDDKKEAIIAYNKAIMFAIKDYLENEFKWLDYELKVSCYKKVKEYID